jgi:hypothetical protein
MIAGIASSMLAAPAVLPRIDSGTEVMIGGFFKVYSQRTYTLFSDGHFERKTCYTDGSCDPLENKMFHKPGHGDLKHREEVWRNGAWVATVSQYY